LYSLIANRLTVSLALHSYAKASEGCDQIDTLITRTALTNHLPSALPEDISAINLVGGAIKGAYIHFCQERDIAFQQSVYQVSYM